MTVKSNQLEIPYTQADKDKLDTIESAAEVNPPIASQAVAEAGVDNVQYMTALRVNQAISALGGGGGETNTMSNVGGGAGVFKQKTGVNFEMKTFLEGTGVTFVEDVDTITINASSGGLTDTDDLTEGSTNLYYTEARVNANSSVVANSAKVSADGSIGTHSDVNVSGASNGNVLTYNGSTWVAAAPSGGGASVLNDLTDVTLTSPSNGQVLKYNGSAWVNAAETEGGASAINDLTDVTISSPSNGEVLTYNGSAWVNQAASGGSSGPTIQIILGAGTTIAQRVSNAPVGGIPAGYSLVAGDDGSVDSSIAGTANDLVVIHGQGKVAVRPGITETSGFGNIQNITVLANKLETDQTSQNQFIITGFNTDVSTSGKSYITVDLI